MSLDVVLEKNNKIIIQNFNVHGFYYRDDLLFQRTLNRIVSFEFGGCLLPEMLLCTDLCCCSAALNCGWGQSRECWDFPGGQRRDHFIGGVCYGDAEMSELSPPRWVSMERALARIVLRMAWRV
jgi:hypothetical protein